MKIIKPLLLLTSLAFPLSVLWQKTTLLPYFPPLFALLFFLSALPLKNNPTKQNKKPLYLVLSLFFLFIALFQRLHLMYWYPVLMNLFLLILFAGSLFSPQSLVERIARLKEKELSPKAIQYTRRVTQVWCIIFSFNAFITSYFILRQQIQAWALYSGLIAYIIVALTFTIEYLIRQKIKNHEQH